jgi:hypothetical protein
LGSAETKSRFCVKRDSRTAWLGTAVNAEADAMVANTIQVFLKIILS